jgi:hypothetical protein
MISVTATIGAAGIGSGDNTGATAQPNEPVTPAASVAAPFG